MSIRFFHVYMGVMLMVKCWVSCISPTHVYSGVLRFGRDKIHPLLSIEIHSNKQHVTFIMVLWWFLQNGSLFSCFWWQWRLIPVLFFASVVYSILVLFLRWNLNIKVRWGFNIVWFLFMFFSVFNRSHIYERREGE